MKQTKKELEKEKRKAEAAKEASEEKDVKEGNETGGEKPETEESKAEPEDNLEKRNQELEAANRELAEKLAREKDDYIRLMAEFETFRRRTAEEKLELVNSAASETIKGLLPVLDDCERALELLEKSSDEAAKEGTGLIYTKLMQYLKKKGLEKIEAKGQKFDTDFHEAVAQVPVPEEDKKGLVFDVIETGYTLGGKILRYAKVVVGV
ncbi:MAG: nucleotide exchange factor GrpE [Candidatus Cryptobacteroides sp.]